MPDDSTTIGTHTSLYCALRFDKNSESRYHCPDSKKDASAAASSVSMALSSIEEPSTFSHKWNSHKLKAARLLYDFEFRHRETTIRLYVLYLCERHPDVIFFHDRLKHLFKPAEIDLADNSHGDVKYENRSIFHPATIA
eukprot:IDg7649t1